MDSVIIDTAKIIKNGNSCAVRLPTSMMKAARLAIGSPVEIMASTEGITIKPQRPSTTYKLTALLAGITDDNLHGEIGFGGPVGKEIL